MARAAAKRSRLEAVRERFSDSFALRVASEAMGLALLALAGLACLALATYSPADPTFELRPVTNWVGPVGATMAGWLLEQLGYGAVLLVACTGWVGGRMILGMGLPPLHSRFWVGNGLLLVGISSLPVVLDSLAPGRLGSPGGALGSHVAFVSQLLLGRWGALLLNSLLLCLGILSVTGISSATALRALGAGAALAGSTALWCGSRAWALAKFGVAKLGEVAGAVAARLRSTTSPLEGWLGRGSRRARGSKPPRAASPTAAEADAEEIGEEEEADEEYEEDEEEYEEEAQRSAKGGDRAEPFIVEHENKIDAKAKPSQEAFRFNDRGPVRPFTLPDVGIFEAPPDTGLSYDRESLLMNSRILEKKLSDFGVMGRVVRVHPGPVVTMYEYEPAAGVKVNKIVNLTDDLAMALSALSVRIIAPLPGKSVVGIEVPNRERETVYLRTLLEARSFGENPGKLMVAMGKDIFGNPVESNLAKMPHLLVAGATGTGKSVFLNALLCSLLARCTPYELKFLMIDPKMLELSVYDGIPHLIAEVVTNPKRAAAALKGVLQKMEERYLIMSALQVRNIDQYNALVEKKLAEGEKTFRLKSKPGEEEGVELPFEHLPYIVVVVDELADLMVVCSKDVEESLQRLAQMARAAGIHLVLATQRPSVDVLTGVIKANFPSRVSFQVSSATDSRTVLDQKGAESLLGHGDMLFLPPGSSMLRRLHGPFVTEKEVMELVAYLRDQGEPEFDEELIKAGEAAAERGGSGDNDVDEMFDQAVAIVAETRNASISYIQRRLKVGYNRAARIVEHMEIEGMVGPQEGTRPREVFLPAHDDD